MTRKRFVELAIIIFFGFTRWFIWTHPSPTFTDVVYAFMPYAHMWAAGDLPYLKQWFEYPPATIPIIYIPHLVDMATLHQPWHLNYAQFFRLELLLADIVLFSIIFSVLKKLKVKLPVFAGALLYYCLITTKANHFIYDEPELWFVTAVSGTVLLPLLLKDTKAIWARWLSFWLAFALKYVNAPLGFVYAGFELVKKRLHIWVMIAALVLIWGFPLAYFRTSLRVSLVYHQIRGIQIESVPATLARTVDRFTHTEQAVEVFKNYDYVGPVSSKIKLVFDVLLPLSMLVYLVWQARFIFTHKQRLSDLYPFWATQAYIYLFMLVTKVSSTPFFLLHIPLTATFPYRSLKEQLRFTIPSLVIIIISMTKIPDLAVGIFSVHILIGWLRMILFAYLLISWIGLQKRIITSASENIR